MDIPERLDFLVTPLLRVVHKPKSRWLAKDVAKGEETKRFCLSVIELAEAASCRLGEFHLRGAQYDYSLRNSTVGRELWHLSNDLRSILRSVGCPR